MNKNGSQRLIYLNACYPVHGTVLETLGDMSLLEEVCHWRCALGFQNLMPVPVSVFESLSLCLSHSVFATLCLSQSLPLPFLPPYLFLIFCPFLPPSLNYSLFVSLFLSTRPLICSVLPFSPKNQV